MLKKIIVLFLLFALSFSVFATGEKEAVTEEEPQEVIFFRPGIPDDWAESPVILGINEALGIDLQIVTASWGDFSQKRNLILATGEPMDILSLMGDRRFVEDGSIMPLDDYIDPQRHPWISMAVKADTFKPVTYVDGKIYHVPGVNPGSDWCLTIRQDWLDKLGLEAPQSGDDFYNLLKAFKEMDSSGSTVGWCLNGGVLDRQLSPIFNTFGVPLGHGTFKEDWVEKNGTIESILFMPETKAVLTFINKLYNEGLINSDFPSLNGYPPMTEQWIRTGRAGIFYAGNPMGELDDIQANDPDCDLSYLEPWDHDASAGYEFEKARGGIENCAHAIATVSKDPALALDVIEYLNTKEGRMLTVSGVEGVHWANLDSNGYYDRLPAYEEEWNGQSATGYHFYFGAHSLKGFVPFWNYSTFDEAFDNVVVVEDRAKKGTKLDFKVALEKASHWMAGPHPFKFLRLDALSDIPRGDVSSAIRESWMKIITANPSDIDKMWEEYRTALDAVGWQKWETEYKKYYAENK